MLKIGVAYVGEFYKPDSKDNILAGVLTLEKTGTVLLELCGGFTEPYELFRKESDAFKRADTVILGNVVIEGKTTPISLANCYIKKITGTNETYVSQEVLEGIHIEKYEDVVSTKYSFTCTDITKWINRNCFTREPIEKKNENDFVVWESIKYQYTMSETWTVENVIEGLNISLIPTWHMPNLGGSREYLQENILVVFDFQEPVDLLEFNKQQSKFLNLVTLATDKKQERTMLKMSMGSQKNIRVYKFGISQRDINNYDELDFGIEKSKPKQFYLNQLFQFPNDINEWGQLIKTWYASFDKYSRAWTWCFSLCCKDTDKRVEEQFLNYTIALGDYHKQSFQNAFDVNFYTRILQMFEGFSLYSLFFEEDAPKLAEKIDRARKCFVEFSDDEYIKILPNMHLLENKFKILMSYYFLKELRFSEDEIVKIFEKKYWKQKIKQKKLRGDGDE